MIGRLTLQCRSCVFMVCKVNDMVGFSMSVNLHYLGLVLFGEDITHRLLVLTIVDEETSTWLLFYSR